MNLSMLSASATMGQLQQKLDTISNNMTNSGTTGYKRRDAQFADLLSQHVNHQPRHNLEANRLTPYGLRVSSGARLAQTNVRMEQGTIMQTGRALDLALTEPGQFFQVEVTENGQATTQFTRAGAFYLTANTENPDRLNVVTSDGHRLQGTEGPITIPTQYQEIEINEAGQVTALATNGARTVVGTIEIVDIQRPQLLTQAGDNRYALPNLEELELDQQDVYQLLNPVNVRMSQGALEASNVDLGKEMSELIVTQRAYQFNAKAISISDQMLGLINGVR